MTSFERTEYFNQITNPETQHEHAILSSYLHLSWCYQLRRFNHCLFKMFILNGRVHFSHVLQDGDYWYSKSCTGAVVLLSGTNVWLWVISYVNGRLGLCCLLINVLEIGNWPREPTVIDGYTIDANIRQLRSAILYELLIVDG